MNLKQPKRIQKEKEFAEVLVLVKGKLAVEAAQAAMNSPLLEAARIDGA